MYDGMGFGMGLGLSEPRGAIAGRKLAQLKRDRKELLEEQEARKMMLAAALEDYDFGDLADDLPKLLAEVHAKRKNLAYKSGIIDLEELSNRIGRLAWDRARES